MNLPLRTIAILFIGASLGLGLLVLLLPKQTTPEKLATSYTGSITGFSPSYGTYEVQFQNGGVSRILVNNVEKEVPIKVGLTDLFVKYDLLHWKKQYGQAQSEFTTISLEKPQLKTIQVFDISMAPEGFSTIRAEIETFLTSPDTNQSADQLPKGTSFAEDYLWVVGVLRFTDVEGGFWQIQYRTNEEDAYDGHFVLGNPPIVSWYKDGDFVRIYGKPLDTPNIYMAGTMYEVNFIEKVQ